MSAQLGLFELPAALAPVALFRCKRCDFTAAREHEGHGPVPRPWRACPHCGGPVTGGLVDGAYSDGIRCDASCQYARGPSCDCSCGGANHGRGWLGR